MHTPFELLYATKMVNYRYNLTITYILASVLQNIM